jgi:signal transduction histidine kinase
MKPRFGKGLRTRLNLIVLLTVVPAWVLTVYTAAEQRRFERESIYQNALLLTRAIADEETQMLRAARATLLVMTDLAARSSRRAGRQCNGFEDFLEKSSEYLQLGILDLNGGLLCQAGGDGRRRSYADASWFTKALRSRRFTLGGDRVATISGRPAIFAARPLADAAGRVSGVVFAALSLDEVSRPVFKILGGLPKGSTLVQIDPGHGQLVYDADSRRWTDADLLTPALVDRIARQDSGVLHDDGVGDDGRIYAFASLSSSLKGRSVFVVLVIPKARAFAVSNHILVRNLLLLAIVAAVAVAVVWIATDLFFLRPLGAMASAGQRLADGALDTRIGDISGADELRRLARGFDEMAAALETRMSREQEARRQLEASRKQLRDLTGYLQDIREQERTRIARELHDDFGQSLTILKLDLSWLKKRLPAEASQIPEKLEEMGQVIDSSLETMHSVTAELRPVILDDFGLSAAMEWQTSEFKERTGLDCRFDISRSLPAISKQMSTAVFRIFQEILTNVVRHAEARRVEIRLRAENRNLVLEVEDDGRGIADAQVQDAHSFGLIGIRERLHPFGGSVRFTGHPGRGTRVTVVIPIEEEIAQS